MINDKPLLIVPFATSAVLLDIPFTPPTSIHVTLIAFIDCEQLVDNFQFSSSALRFTSQA